MIEYGRETTIFGSCQKFIIFTEIRTRLFFNVKRIIKFKSLRTIPPYAIV